MNFLSHDIPIGRTILTGFSKEKNKLHLKDKAMSIGSILNRADRNLPDEKEVLSKRELQLLYMLEARSRKNNGDCKWYDSKIAKMMRLSERTIQRYMRTLEKYEFIIRLTTRFYNPDRKGKFKCLRVIRCTRNFVYNFLETMTTQEMGWKSKVDNRPDIKPEEYPVDKRWLVRYPQWIYNKLKRKHEHVIPKFSSEPEMFRYGMWSFDSKLATSRFITASLYGLPGKSVMGSRVP